MVSAVHAAGLTWEYTYNNDNQLLTAQELTAVGGTVLLNATLWGPENPVGQPGGTRREQRGGAAEWNCSHRCPLLTLLWVANGDI